MGRVQAHTHLLTVTHSTQHDEENRKSRLMGQCNKGRKEKKKNTSQVVQRQSLTAGHNQRCAASHQTTAIVALEGNPSQPRFLLLLRMLSSMDYLSGQFGSAVSPPHFLSTPSILPALWREWETESFYAVQGLFSYSQNTGCCEGS